MNRTISPERSLEIIADLADAALDIRGIAAKYGVNSEDLAKWVLSERTQQILAGLCVLTDYQTQLLLSHHRVTAVSRLVEMLHAPREALGEDGRPLPPEQQPERPDPDLVRKACVDLLRLNMGRIDSAPTTADEPADYSREALRKLFYGDLAKPANAEKPAATTSEAPATAPETTPGHSHATGGPAQSLRLDR